MTNEVIEPMVSAENPNINNPEVPPEVPAQPTEVVEPKDYDKFSAILKKEKAIFKKQQEIQAKEKEIQGKLAEYEARIKSWEDKKANASKDPDSWLKEAGLDYNKITERQLMGDEITPKTALEQAMARIDQLEQSLKQKDEKKILDEKETAEKTYNEQIQAYFSGVEQTIKADADRWATLNSTNQVKLVSEIIQEGWKLGKNIDPKDAADEAEKILDMEIQKVLDLPKFSSKYKKIEAQELSSKNEIDPDSEAIIAKPSLTNDITASQLIPAATTAEERRARAIAAGKAAAARRLK